MVPKRHHVMKLYKKTKCRECKGEGKCYDEGEGTAFTCEACNGLCFIFTELDPADLKELNMGYAWLVESFKKFLSDSIAICDLTLDQKQFKGAKDHTAVCKHQLKVVQAQLESLESRLDAEGEKKLIEARAWEITVRDHELGVIEEKSIIKEARAELVLNDSEGLEAGRDTSKDEKGETK